MANTFEEGSYLNIVYERKQNASSTQIEMGKDRRKSIMSCALLLRQYYTQMNMSLVAARTRIRSRKIISCHETAEQSNEIWTVVSTALTCHFSFFLRVIH